MLSYCWRMVCLLLIWKLGLFDLELLPDGLRVCPTRLGGLVIGTKLLMLVGSLFEL